MSEYKKIIGDELMKQYKIINKVYKFFEKRMEQLDCDFIVTNEQCEKLRIALKDTITFYEEIKEDEKGE